MDLAFLLSNALLFVAEAAKYYDVNEKPINSYITKQHVVILSSKRIFIYYFDQYIDIKYDYFSNFDVQASSESHSLCIESQLNHQQFDINFNSSTDYENFMMYYEKYR